MATHSSVPARRIPEMGDPGGLPSMGSHRVGHDWSNLAAVAAAGKPGMVGHSTFCPPHSLVSCQICLFIALWTIGATMYCLWNVGLGSVTASPDKNILPSSYTCAPLSGMGMKNQRHWVPKEGTSSATCSSVTGQYIGQPAAGEAHGTGCPWFPPP